MRSHARTISNGRLWLLIIGNLVYAGALIALALIPHTPAALRGITVSDVVAHAIAYGLQAGMLLLLLRSLLATIPAYLLSWLGASLFGLLTELLQMPLKARSAELADLAADAIGAALVLVVLRGVELVLRKSRGI
jgi:VanZ family protein